MLVLERVAPENGGRKDAYSDTASARARTIPAGRDEPTPAEALAGIHVVMRRLAERRIFPNPGGQFLDFGCGIGNTSRALLEYFVDGYGIDQVQSSVDEARRLSSADARRPTFLFSPQPDLGLIATDTIDLIYSNGALERLSSASQARYIDEFFRVLKPGGIAVFRALTGTSGATGRQKLRLAKAMRRIAPVLIHAAPASAPARRMNVLLEQSVREIVGHHYCVLLEAPYVSAVGEEQRAQIEFISRADALCEMATGLTERSHLSQYFFVLK